MSCVNKAILWIYIICIMMGLENCNEDKVFAITGCNATLEWNIGNISFDVNLFKVKVFDSKGTIIARFNGLRCKNVNDLPINCTTTNRTGKWMLSVVLINVKPPNEGIYTSQIEYGLENETRNITKHLILIDKPKVKKPPKAIIGMPLNITCTIEGIRDYGNYQWKLNETDLNSLGRIYARSSTLMFESVLMVDKSSVFLCELCQENSCCIQSETFVLDPYYAYTEPSSLEHSDGSQLKLLGLGFTIFAVILIIVGFLIMILLRRKHIARIPDTFTMDQAIDGPANREIRRQFLNFEKYNRPIPIPSSQENACTRVRRSMFPNSQRKSRSLQTLLNRTSDYCNPAWKSMSLQSLIELSDTIGRRVTSDDSLSTLSHSKKDTMFNVQRASNRIRVDEHCSKACKDNNVDFSVYNSPSENEHDENQEKER